MTKVKVFVYGRRRRHRRRRRRGYDNSSPNFRHGELKNWAKTVAVEISQLMTYNNAQV